MVERWASSKLKKSQDIDQRCQADGHECFRLESFQLLKVFRKVFRP